MPSRIFVKSISPEGVKFGILDDSSSSTISPAAGKRPLVETWVRYLSLYNANDKLDKDHSAHVRNAGRSLKFYGNEYLLQHVNQVRTAVFEDHPSFALVGTAGHRHGFHFIIAPPKIFKKEEEEMRWFCNFVMLVVEISELLPDQNKAQEGLSRFLLHIVWPQRRCLVARSQLADFLQRLDMPDAPTMSSEKMTTGQVNLVRKQLAEFLITKVVGSMSPSVKDAIELYFREKTTLYELQPAHKPSMKYLEFAKETGSVPLESIDNYADIINPDRNLLQTLEKYKAVSFHHDGNILRASKESVHTALKHYFDSQGVDATAYFSGEQLERLWSNEQSAKKPSEVGRHLSCSDVRIIKLLYTNNRNCAVFLVCLKTDPTCLFALKMETLDVYNFIKYAAVEIETGGSLDHCNIVKIFGFQILPLNFDENDQTVTFVTFQELGGPSLRQKMKSFMENLPLDDDGTHGLLLAIGKDFVSISKAVYELHVWDIVHRDVKPDNFVQVVVARVVHGVMPWYDTETKMIDFGRGKPRPIDDKKVDEQDFTLQIGSDGYRGHIPGKPQDIYGIGVSLHEYITGQKRKGKPKVTTYASNFKKRHPLAPADAMDALATIVYYCLHDDEKTRWNIAQVYAAFKAFNQAVISNDWAALSGEIDDIEKYMFIDELLRVDQETIQRALSGIDQDATSIENGQDLDEDSQGIAIPGQDDSNDEDSRDLEQNSQYEEMLDKSGDGHEIEGGPQDFESGQDGSNDGSGKDLEESEMLEMKSEGDKDDGVKLNSLIDFTAAADAAKTPVRSNRRSRHNDIDSSQDLRWVLAALSNLDYNGLDKAMATLDADTKSKLQPRINFLADRVTSTKPSPSTRLYFRVWVQVVAAAVVASICYGLLTEDARGIMIRSVSSSWGNISTFISHVQDPRSAQEYAQVAWSAVVRFVLDLWGELFTFWSWVSEYFNS
jgi:serine/threonine protein kinase